MDRRPTRPLFDRRRPSRSVPIMGIDGETAVGVVRLTPELEGLLLDAGTMRLSVAYDASVTPPEVAGLVLVAEPAVPQ